MIILKDVIHAPVINTVMLSMFIILSQDITLVMSEK